MKSQKFTYEEPQVMVFSVSCENVIAISTDGAFNDYDPVDLSDKFGINML